MSLAMTRCKRQHGFTLVELIMVIVIMGVIGGMVSVFMKSPIDAYLDSVRRAALTDVADTVVRRMARDIQKALPNSVNTSGDNLCVEFIPTKTGGRYRADEKVLLDDTSLDFSKADSTFNMLGSNMALPSDQQIKQDDVIVVYNLGITDSDAYQSTSPFNRAAVAATPTAANETGTPLETQINITPATKFPLASGSSRFHVVPNEEKVVAYVCSNGNLYRTASTSLAHICPAAVTSGSPSISSAPILARNVTCTVKYSGSDLQRNALVSMVLQVTDSSSGESVSLQHEVHVSNTP